MNPIDYSELVKKHISDNWDELRKELKISDDDLNVALRIFGELAVEKYETDLNFTLNPSLLDEKIKKFIEKRSYFFVETCYNSFPFSLIDYSLSKYALKRSFKTHNSIVAKLMTFEKRWLNEEALDNLLGNIYQQINIDAIAEACSQFYQKYWEGNLRSGYYFLWLLKKVSEADFLIPEEEDFNSSSVSDTLSRHLHNQGKINKIQNFLEILFYTEYLFENLLYQTILDNEATIIFLNIAIQQFELIPLDQWPNKIHLLSQLLKNDIETKAIVSALIASKDTDTAKVGTYIFNAFERKSFNEALPHLYELSEFIPHTVISSIFKYPFIEFSSFIEEYNDPEFVKRLNFSNGNEIFVHNSLMIGTYYEGYKGTIPYLVAFDLNTEKIIWGIPLMTKEKWGKHSLTKFENYLCLASRESKSVKCIHLESGQIESFKLEKSYLPFDYYFVINPNGLIYERTGIPNTLIGYSKDNPNKILFKSKEPIGPIESFSTHCGFLDTYINRLILFNPEGKKDTIDNCLAAAAYGMELYTIEKDTLNKNNCYLKVRNLNLSSESAFSEVIKTISLNVSKAKFGNLCLNGELILFSNESLMPIFVDVKNQTVTYSDYKIEYNAEKFIDQKTGEIWIIDPSQEICKISSTQVTFMGTMEKHYDMLFMYAENNKLYIC